jgi:hypothetical protein
MVGQRGLATLEASLPSGAQVRHQALDVPVDPRVHVRVDYLRSGCCYHFRCHLHTNGHPVSRLPQCPRYHPIAFLPFRSHITTRRCHPPETSSLMYVHISIGDEPCQELPSGDRLLRYILACSAPLAAEQPARGTRSLSFIRPRAGSAGYTGGRRKHRARRGLALRRPSSGTSSEAGCGGAPVNEEVPIQVRRRFTCKSIFFRVAGPGFEPGTP